MSWKSSPIRVRSPASGELLGEVPVDTPESIGRALTRARAADDALANGTLWGPLHGVPFTIKDQIETKGIVTTDGCPELRN